MGPDEVLRVGVAARDDLAVASAELHYAVERAGSSAEPSAARSPRRWRAWAPRAARGRVVLI
jgi:hypothetical protein